MFRVRIKARAQTIGRFVLGGPVALIAAVLAMAATPVWLPAGDSGVDNIVLPGLMFPAYWALFFVTAIVAEHVWRAFGIVTVVSLVHGYLIYGAFHA